MLAVDPAPCSGVCPQGGSAGEEGQVLQGSVWAAPVRMKIKQPKDKRAAIHTEQPDK